MSFYRSRGFWIALIITPLLLIAANHGIKFMTSIYKSDLGNGVVIYADDYVKSGKWVFDCKYRRLISRQPLPIPTMEMENSGALKFGKMYALSEADKVLAMEILRATVKKPNWYQGLHYLYSGLDESSDLRYHSFYLLVKDTHRTWAVEVDQSIGYDGKSGFKLTARPYDPETYVDYAKALQTAAQSCPVPQ